MPIGPSQWENIRIDGFIPVIINIIPVTNLPFLLGVTEKSGEPLALKKGS